MVVALGVGLFVWRKIQAEKRATTHPRPARPEAVPSTVSFACPGCQKTLKARPELAGKKVKCPQCGEAVNVPSIQTSVSSSAGSPEPGKASRSQA